MNQRSTKEMSSQTSLYIWRGDPQKFTKCLGDCHASVRDGSQ